MKRLILWLVLGAGVIHGFNMLAPSSRDWGSLDSHSKTEAHTQSIETQSIENKRVDSWGAYLPHVPRALTERQHQEGQQLDRARSQMLWPRMRSLHKFQRGKNNKAKILNFRQAAQP
jgi:hypothetical protein